MTIGILCLDGLDHRLCSKHDVFEPAGIDHQPLMNNLEGTHPLFTPRVWNSLFLGEDQTDITGWQPQADWEETTSDWDFLWDQVVATSVLNVNIHTGYFHQNACIPEGWTPAHGNFEQMQESTLELIDHWNRTLAEKQPPLQIGYWRLPDAYGHRAGNTGWTDHETCYSWIRERFWDEIDLPDQWLVLSDHGFTMDPSTLDSHAGRKAHTEHGVTAATWDLPQRKMSDWIPTWQDMVLEQVRTQHLEAMGYLS